MYSSLNNVLLMDAFFFRTVSNHREKSEFKYSLTERQQLFVSLMLIKKEMT